MYKSKNIVYVVLGAVLICTICFVRIPFYLLPGRVYSTSEYEQIIIAGCGDLADLWRYSKNETGKFPSSVKRETLEIFAPGYTYDCSGNLSIESQGNLYSWVLTREDGYSGYCTFSYNSDDVTLKFDFDEETGDLVFTINKKLVKSISVK